MAQRTPAATGESMSESVEVMIADLGPLDPERSVLAAMARQLARTLDSMSRPMAARMVGQTSGQLLKVLDKLGLPRRPPPPGVAVAVAAKSTGEVWYEGIEDDLYAEHLAWIVQRHAVRSGGRLPVPGTEAYSRDPWAPDEYGYVAGQRGPGARARRRAGWQWMSGEQSEARPTAVR